MRDFWRFYLLKILLVIVALQLVLFFWLEKRNHRPEAVNDESSVYEGQSVKILPLRNDMDKDEDEIIIHDVLSALYGEITINEDLVIYSVGKGFTGIDSFAYTISDGKKESREAFIKVTINENLGPVANKDHIHSYVGNKIPLIVLGNDEDREGDSIFIQEFSNPLYGKVLQDGNMLFYTSTDNSFKIDSFQYILSDGFTNSEKATVTIMLEDKNNSCYPWLSADVGNPALAGNMVRKNNNLIIKGSGNDIWNDVDNFHYAYQILDGDCEMVTKIISIDTTDQWAKGGIMVREALTGPSRNVYMCLSQRNGVNCQIRFDTGARSTSENQRGGIEAPYWVKLVRKGNQFTGYRSPDGIEWTQVRTDSIDLPKIVYIGLAVTSHNDEALCAVHYDLAKTMLNK